MQYEYAQETDHLGSQNYCAKKMFKEREREREREGIRIYHNSKIFLPGRYP